MRVEAIKTKDGYFIPAVGSLGSLKRKKVMLNIEIISEEKSYKQMAAQAACERYLGKQQQELPGNLTTEDLAQIDAEFGLQKIHTIDDVLEQI